MTITHVVVIIISTDKKTGACRTWFYLGRFNKTHLSDSRAWALSHFDALPPLKQSTALLIKRPTHVPDTGLSLQWTGAMFTVQNEVAAGC